MSFWKKVAKKLLGNPRPASPKPRLRPILLLERLEHRDAPAVLTVNTADDNNTRDDFLSLREAMLVADGQLPVNNLTQKEQAQITGSPTGPSYDTIQFNIGNQAETITLMSTLPSLSAGPVFINGAPPPGSPNQTITIDGTNSVAAPGFDLNRAADGSTTTSGSTIQGLTMQNFKNAAIQIESDNNTIGGSGAGQQNTLTGNYNGVVITGSAAYKNTVADNTITNSKYAGSGGDTGYGVRIVQGANNNTIGATATTDPKTGVITAPANVISGSAAANVAIGDIGSNQNTVIGNFIGLDKDGKTALQNAAAGVAILNGAKANQIGGPAAGPMNVISANPKGGIIVAGNGTTNNTIGGNIIGTSADGSSNTVGNGVAGVVFDGTAAFNIVRNSQIKYNPDGVLNPGKKNKIYDPNSIFGNDYGIVDGDSAGTPVLTSAVEQNGSLTVQGTLSSTPSTQFILEFFGNPITDPVGHEQGAFYLGNLTVTTDANGNATFQTSFNTIYGVNVSATATGVADSGWTSQFSNEAPIVVPVLISNYPGAVFSLKGTVWNDTDGNQTQDPGEASIAGTVVNLFNASGQLVATTTTDANGAYVFSNVAPAQYYVQFIPPLATDSTQPYLPTAQIIVSADLGGGMVESAGVWTGRVDPNPWGW